MQFICECFGAVPCKMHVIVIIAFVTSLKTWKLCKLVYLLLSGDRQVLNVTSGDDDVSVSNQSTLLSPQRQILNVPTSPSTQHRSEVPYW